MATPKQISAPVTIGVQGTGNINIGSLGNPTNINGDMYIFGMTASKPLILDGSNKVLSGNINLATQVSGILPIANGGTGSSTVPAIGSSIYSNGTQLVGLAPGTSGYILTTFGAGLAPNWTDPSLTARKSLLSRKSGTQLVANGIGGSTITGWSTSTAPEYDTLGAFNVVTGIFTPLVSAAYNISINVTFTNPANDGDRTLEIYDTISSTVYSRVTIQPTPDILLKDFLAINTNLFLSTTNPIAFRIIYNSSVAGNLTVFASPSTFLSISKN